MAAYHNLTNYDNLDMGVLLSQKMTVLLLLYNDTVDDSVEIIFINNKYKL